MRVPMTHEERLARDIDRCRQLARELGMTSTEYYLHIALSKLKDERIEAIRRKNPPSTRGALE